MTRTFRPLLLLDDTDYVPKKRMTDLYSLYSLCLSITDRTNRMPFHLQMGMVPGRSVSGLSTGADWGQHGIQAMLAVFFPTGLGVHLSHRFPPIFSK